MSTTHSPVSKPLAVKYPFVTASGQEYRDLDTLLNDLGAQSGGYYLLGANNYWHGGIHITDEKFIQHKQDHPVRCMMDGTVVAYRLNRQYPTQKWQPNSHLPAKDLKFSNGFCLVRHEYESAANQLTFYSLYMHLADYSTYVADTESSVKTIAITKDTNARHAENITHVTGVLKQGSTVQIDLQQDPKQATVRGRRYRYYLVTVQAPTVGSTPAVTTGMQVYLYAGCFPAETFTAAEKPKLPGYWKATVTGKSKEPMWIYDSQAHCTQRNVQPVTVLNPEQPCTFQTGKIIKNITIQGKVHSIAECQFPSSATFRGDKIASGWMIVDDSQLTWEKVEPTEFDSIVKLTEPLPIAAGDPIGLMGIWESPEAPFMTGTTKTRYQMHVELFTADDKTKLEAFLSNSAGLTTGKKYLKVPKGSKLYSGDGHGNFVNPDPLLNAARDYVFEESACAQVIDTAGTVFYNLKGIKTGEAAIGPVDFAHVKIEGNVKLITQHDWQELGFTTIEETNDDADGYINPEKITSPLFQDIFKRIDGINSQNGQGNGVLTGSEIKNALQQDKELRNDLYKIIAGHPSEWHRATQNNMKAHVDELNVENTEESKNTNQFEVERFLQCEFVSQIEGLTQKLWHFHPMYSVYILGNDDEMDLKWLKVPKGQLTFDAEGKDIDNSIYFSRHPHVPNNHGVVIGLSGVTLGRGLDFGQQSREYIEYLFSEMEKHARPLQNSFREWLLGAVGKQGSVALSYCRNIDSYVPIEGQFITRKQQHFLFNAVYQYLYDVTKRTLSKGENIDGENISVDIKNYEQNIQDVLVDLTFRGDNRKSTRKYFLKDLQGGKVDFKKNISNTYWKDNFAVPEQRFNIRKDYI